MRVILADLIDINMVLFGGFAHFGGAAFFVPFNNTNITKKLIGLENFNIKNFHGNVLKNDECIKVFYILVTLNSKTKTLWYKSKLKDKSLSVE